jgi:hypothetical protein
MPALFNQSEIKDEMSVTNNNMYLLKIIEKIVDTQVKLPSF